MLVAFCIISLCFCLLFFYLLKCLSDFDCVYLVIFLVLCYCLLLCLFICIFPSYLLVFPLSFFSVFFLFLFMFVLAISALVPCLVLVLYGDICVLDSGDFLFLKSSSPLVMKIYWKKICRNN